MFLGADGRKEVVWKRGMERGGAGEETPGKSLGCQSLL